MINEEDITNVIESCKEVNYENALVLNQAMQSNLLKVRTELLAALSEIEIKYSRNQTQIESFLKIRRHTSFQGAYLQGATFYFKGNMFFKDAKGRNCPNNADYEKRREEGEMFPMDLELHGRHIWTMMDKVGLVQAIKEQVVSYINDVSNCKTNGKLCRKKTIKIQGCSDKLVNLLKKVEGSNFQINWDVISKHNLRHRHTNTSCKAMWQVYLNPKLKQCEWSAIESECLLKIAKQYEYTNWPEIASHIPQRSDYQCFVQYYTNVYLLEPNLWKRWNKKDDSLLLESINKHTYNGVINWNLVSSEFPHKSKSSIHGRYTYYLHPSIIKAPFTSEEDLLILAAVKEYGPNFKYMPRNLFQNRSLAQIRSRYNNVLKLRHKQQPWTIEDDCQLLQHVSVHGSSDWLKCAEAFEGRHTRISCRTRFMIIKNHFLQNPKAKLSDLPRLKLRRSRVCSGVNAENWEEKIKELQKDEFELVNEVPVKRYKLAPCCNKDTIKVYCNYFQFSSRYNPTIPIPSTVRKINKLIQYMELFNFQPKTAELSHTHFPQKFKTDLKQLITFNNDKIKINEIEGIKASYSTGLCFLAMCVQNGEVKSYNLPENEKIEKEKQMFEKRFYALFTQTFIVNQSNVEYPNFKETLKKRYTQQRLKKVHLLKKYQNQILKRKLKVENISNIKKIKTTDENHIQNN